MQAFFKDTSFLPMLESYEDAHHYYHERLMKSEPNLKIYRDKGIMPIGYRYYADRRRLNVTMSEANHARGKAYTVDFHGLTLIEFHENGDIVIKNHGKKIVSIAEIIQKVLGGTRLQLWTDSHGIEVRVPNAAYHLPKTLSHYGESITLRFKGYVNNNRDYERDYEVIKCPKTYEYRLIRKEMNALRQKYKPFTDYMYGIAGIVDDLTQLKDYRSFGYKESTELIESEDVSEWYKVATWALKDSANREFSWDTGWTHKPNPKKAKALVETHLKYRYSDTLFKRIEQPKGKYKICSNTKFI